MNDLFESINEIREERAAICEFDGLLTREQAEKQGLLESEQYRVACEVRKAMEMPLNELLNVFWLFNLKNLKINDFSSHY